MSSKPSEEVEKINIRRFNLESIKADAMIVCIGRRRVGKSFLTRAIMKMLANRGMPYGKVYSGTEHCSPFFRKFFPRMFIDNSFTDQDLANIIQMQYKKTKKAARRMGTDEGKCLENNMLLVFDDMMSEEKIWKVSKHFKKLFTEGRHFHILVVLILQYVLGIPPALRDNIDYAFLFANDGSALKKLYDNYCGVFPNFKLFREVFEQCTKDHRCMVIDKTVTSDNWQDKVFYYKATDPGKFRFGSRAFWALHDENYYSSDDDDDDETNAQKKMKNIIHSYGEHGKTYVINID